MKNRLNLSNQHFLNFILAQRRWRFGVATGISFLLMIGLFAVASAQTVPFGAYKKVLASDGASNNLFGEAVAVSGDLMVVGAPIVSSRGAIYLFERDSSGTWVQVKKILEPSGNSWGFGLQVAIDQNTIAAGTGSTVFAFERDQGGTNNWGQIAQLSGSSVSISNDMIVIGSPYESGKGIVYVYARNFGGLNTWGQITQLTASDATDWSGDHFGSVVSVDGNTVIVGAPYDDAPSSNSGSVYIFERNHGGIDNWGQVKKLTASIGGSNQYFGNSIDISGDTAVIGSENTYQAYIFERDAGGVNNWGESKILYNYSNYFGSSVSIDGDTMVFGTYHDYNQWGIQSGTAYVYGRYYITDTTAITTTWNQIAKLAPIDGSFNEGFGYDVDVDAGTVVVSAYQDDDLGYDSGSVHVYTSPSLYIPNDSIDNPAATGHVFSVPVIFESGSPTYTISSLGFSIDYDEFCLDLISTDTDIQNSIPAGFAGQSVTIDKTDLNGELDVAFWDPGDGTPSVLNDGPVITMDFSVNAGCRNPDQLVNINFSGTPPASFGHSSGHDLDGTTAGAAVRLLYSGPPTDITIDSGYIEEGEEIGTLIGNFFATDPNISDVHTYTVIGGDIGAFAITGYTLTSGIIFNYDIQNTYAITVRATDSAGNTLDKLIPITVTAPPRLSIRDVNYISSSITSVVSYTHSIDLNVHFENRGNVVPTTSFSVTYDTTKFVTIAHVSNFPSGLSSGFVSSHNGITGLLGITLTGSVTNPLTAGVIATLHLSATGEFTSANSLLTTLNFISATVTSLKRTITNTWELTETTPISISKSLYVIPNSIRGDCNHSGRVGAGDFGAIILERFDGDNEFWLSTFDVIPYKGSPIGCDANAGLTIRIADVVETVSIFFSSLPANSRFANIADQIIALDEAASLSINSSFASTPGGSIDVPVVLNSNDNNIAAAAFSLGFDSAQMSFDSTDNDGDGLPDAITFNIPDGILPVATFDTNQNEVNVALFGVSTPLPVLNDGAIATVHLNVQPSANVSSTALQLTRGSLGDTQGEEVEVALDHGLVKIANPNTPNFAVQIYMPMIK